MAFGWYSGRCGHSCLWLVQLQHRMPYFDCNRPGFHKAFGWNLVQSLNGIFIINRDFYFHLKNLLDFSQVWCKLLKESGLTLREYYMLESWRWTALFVFPVSLFSVKVGFFDRLLRYRISSNSLWFSQNIPLLFPVGCRGSVPTHQLECFWVIIIPHNTIWFCFRIKKGLIVGLWQKFIILSCLKFPEIVIK